MAEATITIEEISAQAGAKAMLVTITGQLDESNVDDKSKEVYKILEDNPGKVSLVFDLAGLEYMNSKSIGYLTDWYGKVKERGGDVFISRAKDNIADILQVVGLTQLIKTFESVDEAKQAVLQVPAETPAAPAAEAPAPVAAEPAKPVEAPAEIPAEPAPTPEAPAPVAPEAAPVEEPKAETPAPEPEQPAAPEAPAPETPAGEGSDTFSLNA